MERNCGKRCRQQGNICKENTGRQKVGTKDVKVGRGKGGWKEEKKCLLERKGGLEKKENAKL